MKKIVLFAGLAMSLCASFGSQAQVRVNVNIGAPVQQQSWYANDNDYYYMPEQGVYYNVRRRVYVYPEGGRWLYANQLPARYGHYSYRNSHYVQVRDRSPFDRDNDYRQRYQSNGGNRGGYGNGNNPRYNGRHDNGNHNGWDRNRDNRGGSNGWDRNGRDNRGTQDNRTDRSNGGNFDNNKDTRGNRGGQPNVDRNNTNQGTNVNQSVSPQNSDGRVRSR